MDDNGFLGDGLELASERLLGVEHDADLLAGTELFDIIPGGILGAAERGTDKQCEKHHLDTRRAHLESRCVVQNESDHTPIPPLCGVLSVDACYRRLRQVIACSVVLSTSCCLQSSDLKTMLTGATIRRELIQCADKDVGVGAIYSGLDRFEEKGFVESWMGEPTAARRARAVSGSIESHQQAAVPSPIWIGLCVSCQADSEPPDGARDYWEVHAKRQCLEARLGPERVKIEPSLKALFLEARSNHTIALSLSPKPK